MPSGALGGRSKQAFHPDHLSVRVTTNSSGALVGQQGHYPFGESWYSQNTTTKWQSTSYERDSESGLDYAVFRYHASRLGRFMTPDPTPGWRGNPQSLNRYSYVLNQPINLVDPLGLFPCPLNENGDFIPMSGCDPTLDLEFWMKGGDAFSSFDGWCGFDDCDDFNDYERNKICYGNNCYTGGLYDEAAYDQTIASILPNDMFRDARGFSCDQGRSGQHCGAGEIFERSFSFEQMREWADPFARNPLLKDQILDDAEQQFERFQELQERVQQLGFRPLARVSLSRSRALRVFLRARPLDLCDVSAFGCSPVPQ